MNNYYCECCNYDAKVKSSFDKHLRTKKHIKRFQDVSKMYPNVSRCIQMYPKCIQMYPKCFLKLKKIYQKYFSVNIVIKYSNTHRVKQTHKIHL